MLPMKYIVTFSVAIPAESMNFLFTACHVLPGKRY